MITIGIDPDTANTGIAVVEDGEVMWVGTASARGATVQDRLPGMAEGIRHALNTWAGYFSIDPDVCAIEWQRLRPRGERNPNSIVDLNGVAGMCLQACLAEFGSYPQLLTPIPVQWKGSVPKAIHQARILGKVDLCRQLIGVQGAEKMTKTQKGHVVDAIGLALWAAEQR